MIRPRGSTRRSLRASSNSPQYQENFFVWRDWFAQQPVARNPLRAGGTRGFSHLDRQARKPLSGPVPVILDMT
jgi:hypothetical protein